MNRIGAAEIAIEQAGEKSVDSVLASDAFFPMPDTVEAVVKAGVTAIIQPGGSKRDQDSIDVCNEHGIAMVFTKVRHFKHYMVREIGMKVLVVGRGGREHSVVEQVKKSSLVKEIYCAPGNAGIERVATCIPIDEMEIDELVKFAKETDIDLTIVGPENPLNAGIANAFQEANLPIFAPTKEAALLEGSKEFAKQFMMKYDIPTAAYKSFTDASAAKEYVKDKGAPIVIKADGLAEGKGVVVAETVEQSLEAIDFLMVEGAFSGAGEKVVIEEFLEGREFSLIAFVHEHQVFPM